VVLTGLQPSTTYTFRVRAIAPGRKSDFTNEVTVTTEPAN